MKFENWGWDSLGEQNSPFLFFFRCIPEFTPFPLHVCSPGSLVEFLIYKNDGRFMTQNNTKVVGWYAEATEYKRMKEKVCVEISTLLYFFKRAFQVKCKCDLGKIYIHRKLHITHLC